MKKLLFFLSLAFLSYLAPVLAENTTPAAQEAVSDQVNTNSSNSVPSEMDFESFDFGQQFLKMMGTLVLLILLILLAAFVFRKTLNTRLGQLNKKSRIKILEKRALSPKSSLYLIELDQQKLLLGESAHGLHSLMNLPNNDPSFEEVFKQKGI